MTDRTIPHGQVTRLLMQHRTALYGYIFACVRNHDDAEDIFQNVCVAVTESIGRLANEAGFLPWAREIARRRILAQRRSTRREQPLDPDLVCRLAEAADRVERVQPASRHRAALTACLESLPAESRRLILMRYESSTARAEELAACFGRSVQGIYAWIKRIKLALRECVERRLAMEGPS
ncbi:MAG TPA: sigma-70 family RNA polymerase sigma factor [Gemmataceae bacterium]|nr:sigma-70 family RNA polymerase sigma factor [Gemmataceae bacterium]